MSSGGTTGGDDDWDTDPDAVSDSKLTAEEVEKRNRLLKEGAKKLTNTDTDKPRAYAAGPRKKLDLTAFKNVGPNRDAAIRAKAFQQSEEPRKAENTAPPSVVASTVDSSIKTFKRDELVDDSGIKAILARREAIKGNDDVDADEEWDDDEELTADKKQTATPQQNPSSKKIDMQTHEKGAVANLLAKKLASKVVPTAPTDTNAQEQAATERAAQEKIAAEKVTEEKVEQEKSASTQALPTVVIPVSKAKPELKKHIIAELKTTEQSYLRDLSLFTPEKISNLLKQFNQLALEQKRGWEKSDLENMLKELVILKESSQQMLAAIESGDFEKVAEQMEKAAEQYKAFASVFKPLPAKLDEQLKFTNKERKELSSFLISPIQRIPRYEMLAKELMKAEPDNKVFSDFHQKARSLNEQMNQTRREADEKIPIHKKIEEAEFDLLDAKAGSRYVAVQKAQEAIDSAKVQRGDAIVEQAEAAGRLEGAKRDERDAKNAAKPKGGIGARFLGTIKRIFSASARESAKRLKEQVKSATAKVKELEVEKQAIDSRLNDATLAVNSGEKKLSEILTKGGQIAIDRVHNAEKRVAELKEKENPSTRPPSMTAALDRQRDSSLPSQPQKPDLVVTQEVTPRSPKVGL